MGNSKTKQRQIRKLMRLGRTSFAVTLPVDMLHKLGWREKQKVVVSLMGRHFVIKDWKRRLPRTTRVV